MTQFSIKKIAGILCTMASLFLVVVGFQNCANDDVGFTFDEASQEAYDLASSRTVFIDPNSTDNRPKIHLTTIVDNSFSTKPIHTNLVAGFSNAIEKVRGFDVDASLYTTSHEKGSDKASSQEEDLVSFKGPGGNEIELPASEKDQIPSTADFVEKTVNRLVPSFFQGRQDISYRFKDGNFDTFKNLYTDGVQNLGTDGSDTEQGLCTLVKKIQQNKNFADPDNLSFHLYLIATNEDDFTSLANCPIETRQETKTTNVEKTESCNAGDPDCEFNYSIDQNPVVTKNASISYQYEQANTRISYQGTKIRERLTYSKVVTDHEIKFQERQAKYKYEVVQTCRKDGVPIACESPDTKYKTLDGSCTVGSQRNCTNGEKEDAAALFGVASSSLYSCKISCNEEWKNHTLAESKIPNKTNSCSQASRPCDNSELSLVAAEVGANTNDIKSCTRTCKQETQNGRKDYYNNILSCSQTSRVCGDDERSIAASRLGVPVSEVTSCNYACSEHNVSSAKTLPSSLTSSTFSCQASDTRNCTNADKDWLMSKNPGFDKDNLKSCQVSCNTSTKTGSVSVATNGLTCPSTNSCNSSQKNIAANDFSGSASDINSCTVSCQENSNVPGRCQLSDIADANACSNSGKIASLCNAKGVSNLNMNSCSRSGGRKTVVTSTRQKGSKETIKINDLEGAENASSLPEMIANHLKAVHGPNGFFTGFFIHPSDDPSCQAPSYLSSGVQYEDLTSILGPNNANSFPVCLSDYSPALDNVLDIAVENVSTTYNVNLGQYEFVAQIEAVQYDGTVETIPKSEYEVFKNSIRFKNKDVFKNVKTLEVIVTKP